MTNEFWLRWRREFLNNLQILQKWILPQRNLSVGDLVIMKENDVTSYKWPLGKVSKVYPSEDGLIRKVRNSQGRRKSPPTYLDRPVQKLVLLLPQEKS